MKINVHPTSAVLGAAGGAVLGSLCTFVLARHLYARRLEQEIAIQVDDVKKYYAAREPYVSWTDDIPGPDVEASVGASELGSDGELEGDEAADAAKRIHALVDHVDGHEPPRTGTKWTEYIKNTIEEVHSSSELERELYHPSPDGEESSGAAGDPPRTDYRSAYSAKPPLAKLADAVPDIGPEEDDEVPDPATVEELDHVDKSLPYVIPVEAMADEGYDNLTLTYYMGDNVLVDDKEEPIMAITRTVGDIDKVMASIPEGEHVAYVRNETLKLDFEICRDLGSYADIVLNYGTVKPIQKETAAKGRN